MAMQKLPNDQIRQWEIAALLHLEAAEVVIMLDFKKRLEAGATVQRGAYFLDPDSTTVSDLRADMKEGGCGGMGGHGFYEIGVREPAVSNRKRKSR
jgi:hypothetical protein